MMENNFSYTINLNTEGGGAANALVETINKLNAAVQSIAASISPLGKITEILGTTNQKLSQIHDTGEKSFQKLDVLSTTTGRRLQDSTEKADHLEKEIKDIGTASKTAGAEVKEGLLDKLSKIGFSIGGIQSIAQGIGAAIAPAFEEGMARQTASVNFATLLRDGGDTKESASEKGKQYADALRNSTAAALYGTSTVNEAAKNMLSFGIDGAKAQTVLTQIGDIAAGDAQKFGSLSLAFAQISSAGKLQGQDLMQLINAGFNPLAEISKKTGKSIGELKDAMAKGAISAEMVEEAFASATAEGGRFHGMLDDIKNNTLQGKMAVLQGSLDDLKAKFFELLAPIVENMLPVVTDSVIPAIQSVVEFLAPVFSLIADNIDTLGVFIGLLGGVAAAAGAVNVVMAANPISLVIIGIAALIAMIYKAIDVYDQWGASLLFLMGPIGMIANLIMTIRRYWDDIVSAFQSDGIIAGLKRIGACILDVVLYPVQQVLGWVAELTGLELAQNAQSVVNGLREKIGAIDPSKQVGVYDPSKDPMVAEAKRIMGADNGNGTQSAMEAAVNGSGGGSAEKLKQAAGKGAEAVASGGTRSTQITITLGNMVETVNFNGTPGDNEQATIDTFTSMLLRVLYSAQTAV